MRAGFGRRLHYDCCDILISKLKEAHGRLYEQEREERLDFACAKQIAYQKAVMLPNF